MSEEVFPSAQSTQAPPVMYFPATQLQYVLPIDDVVPLGQALQLWEVAELE
ncbi:MAG: hypothetical protein P4L78_01315 [Silvimonas sp.]|nr:hypothetical protein [Silvimonas sp.]